MKFNQFVENRHQEIVEELTRRSVSGTIDPFLSQEINAQQDLVSWYRKIYKWIHYPIVIIKYILVLMGKRPEPVPVALNAAKAKQKAEQEAREQALNNNEVTIGSITA